MLTSTLSCVYTSGLGLGTQKSLTLIHFKECSCLSLLVYSYWLTWLQYMSSTKQKINDRATIYRYNAGSDIKLSTAHRLLGVTLTVDDVIALYNLLDNKMELLNKADLDYKTFSRWKRGHCEPMYHKLADLYEYIKEELDGNNC